MARIIDTDYVDRWDRGTKITCLASDDLDLANPNINVSFL